MVARGEVREMNLQSTEDLGLSSLSGMPLCVCVCVCVCVYVCVLVGRQLCQTLCDPMDHIACQAPLSKEFSGQEY